MGEDNQAWNGSVEVLGTRDQVLEPLSGVARRHGVGSLAERLMALRDWLSDDLSDLERDLVAFIDRGAGSRCLDEAPTAPSPAGPKAHLGWQAAAHLLNQAGKRIRPMCLLLAARLGGRERDQAIRDLAVAGEIVHAATLLHDDVIDEGAERRGADAARVVYGNSASILAGDQLFVEALRLTDGTRLPGLLTGMLHVIAEMIRAEAIQLELSGRFQPDRETYQSVIQGKTAALFQWCLVAGGTAAGLSKDDLQALDRAGLSLGIAFQLIDDVLDLEGDPALTGKDVLADLRQGKLTWPFILGAERDPSIAAELAELAAAADDGFEPGRLEKILEQLREGGALDETRRAAYDEADKARAELARFPESPARRALELVVEAAVRRSV